MNDTDYNIEIVKYGLKVIVYNCITIGMILLMSYVLHDLLFSFFFLISFCYLRIKFGGYHCKTYIGCLLSTNISYLIIYILSKNTYYRSFIFIIFIPMLMYYFYLLNYLKEKVRLNSIIFIFMCIVSLYNYNIFSAWSSGILLAEGLFLINKVKVVRIINLLSDSSNKKEL